MIEHVYVLLSAEDSDDPDNLSVCQLFVRLDEAMKYADREFELDGNWDTQGFCSPIPRWVPRDAEGICIELHQLLHKVPGAPSAITK